MQHEIILYATPDGNVRVEVLFESAAKKILEVQRGSPKQKKIPKADSA
ncbi:MAG: hypothetical protein ABR907_16340 [Terracidiphilus sp.]